MINFLLGRPGSGKSYEAVVFHILPALQEGRKVITNLPLNLEVIRRVCDNVDQLLVIKSDLRAFFALDDFADDWKNEKGQGPLYVIDECHKAFPQGKTPLQIEEWFAEHRHLGVDVLLITQSYRKVSRSICDMVQTVYRLSNNRSMGSDKSYIRKVQDGVRGEVLGTSIRTYKPKFFAFYKSHTKTSGSVHEAGVKDIRPIWLSWQFVGAAILFAIGIPFTVYSVYYHNPLSVKTYVKNSPSKSASGSDRSGKASGSSAAGDRPGTHKTGSSRVGNDGGQSSPDDLPSSDQAGGSPESRERSTPFGRVGLHISGYIQSQDKTKTIYQFTASQNGQAVFFVNSGDLAFAGYKIKTLGPCSAELQYMDEPPFYVICDAPRVALNMETTFASQ